MEELMAAIYQRWNAAGLDTTIAPLFRAGEGMKSAHNTTGTTPGTALPRAEFAVTRGSPQNRSRNSRLYQAIATIKIRGLVGATVSGWLETAADAFLNSDAAGTSPLVLATGDVLGVSDGGQYVYKVDDSVHEAELTLLIRHRVNDRIPA